MEPKVKSCLLFSVILILFIPSLQQLLSVVKSGELYNYPPPAKDADFAWKDWMAGTYQVKKGKYLDEGMGFRPDLIRLNNQFEYNLFGVLHTWKAVEGKGHNLYMDSYINSYYGGDYIGYDSVLKKMVMLKAISDTLAGLGKSLILIHAPAKEYMYPEFFPEDMKQPIRTTDNLATYLRTGDSLHINQIDFNGWFCALKKDSKELLYPKQGVHWSVYGSYLAADSLIRYMEQLRGIKMVHPVWKNIVHTTEPRASDDDIARSLNLIYPITTEVFSYPEVTFSTVAGVVKPRVIYVGDSFLPIWINDGIMDNTNTNWQVWQWFSILLSDGSRAGDHAVLESDWIGAIDNTDCVVIMYTAINLSVLGNGFIEAAYRHYYPAGKG